LQGNSSVLAAAVAIKAAGQIEREGRRMHRTGAIRRGRRVLIAILVAAVALLAAASSANSGGAHHNTRPLKLVGIGDSGGDPAECFPCVSYVNLYGDAAASALHRPVRVVNLARSTNLKSAGLLELVRTDEVFRENLASADLVTVGIGNNDIAACDWPPVPADCFEAAIKQVKPNLKATLAAISKLRRDKRTAIRVLGLFNYAIGDPEAPPGEAFQTFFALKVRQLNAAIRIAARSEGAVYVDVFHALNGPSGDEQVTGLFTGAQVQEKVAAAIAATGFAPLCRFGREGEDQ
jgi:hypothetical protein